MNSEVKSNSRMQVVRALCKLILVVQFFALTPAPVASAMMMCQEEYECPWHNEWGDWCMSEGTVECGGSCTCRCDDGGVECMFE